uniref:Uncharacterized protein n=1 Tax=Phlebotomus papatasi TaxID=29031 RepID=A0A1B0D3R3_PHLPP
MLKITRICGIAPQIRVIGSPMCTRTKGGRILQKEREKVERDKRNLEWRETFAQKGEWSSKFGLFASENENADFITMMQQPWDTSIGGVKRWYVRKKERVNRILQSYIPERHEILGSDLAAAHFIVYRGGRVKFVGDPKWVQKDEDTDEYELPRLYDEGYKVEAIDCSRMLLYYEGLENLRCLFHLKQLSFHDIPVFDDWCLDRVSGSEFHNLQELDLTGTKITSRGLCALYRLPRLQKLSLTLPENEVAIAEMKLTGAMLEEAIPGLTVSYFSPSSKDSSPET